MSAKISVSPKQVELDSPFTASASKSITVKNESQGHIAFKVKTTAPKLYCVRPNASTIAPGEELSVQIIFQGLESEPTIGTKCKDKFLIVALPCDADLKPKAVSALWPDLTKTNGPTTDSKLRVVFNFDNAVSAIQEESSQIEEPSKAPVASGSEKAAEVTPLISTTPKEETKAVASPASSETRVAEKQSSNLYIIAIILVLIAYLLAKFIL
ncbi:hypothetical protein CANARDRAFT_5763 [[Candida] arabinofermentans NRRL YB-2248]|uniref:MSP domain-containing protein n=1 Tax=[Candida] arabinofermentans NRRL YB-2248 TaxID=983967 RepID=A0A1E4T624_9ASCO|nr:hypothetical protein CANARDRAFT_5763 [[Candida] arabinofermentans NRRL YB-2248]